MVTVGGRWTEYFLRLCEVNSTMSRDPSTKVGAVIVRPDRTIASMGWNGFPRGVKDDPETYADRPTKLLRTVHAEMNAILSAREPLIGYTLFVAPLHPCATCAGAIIQSGIRRVVARTAGDPAAWAENFAASSALFAEAGVEVQIVSQR
jgi:dCMP deaminase